MPENACVFLGFLRRLVVSQSRRPAVSLARHPAILSHSQTFSVFPSQSRALANRAPQLFSTEPDHVPPPKKNYLQSANLSFDKKSDI